MALNLNQSTGQEFGPAGANHAPGLVPDPGSTAHFPPYVLGDDGAFHSTIPTSQISGTTTDDNAETGNIGEYQSNSAGSTSLSVNIPVNIASITLTPGDWDVWGSCSFTGTSTTTFNQLIVSIGTTSATLFETPGQCAELTVANNTPGFNHNNIMTCGPLRMSIAVNTTVYLVAQASFTASTISADGLIQARRMR